MKYYDQKITIWQRMHLSDDADLDKITDLIKEGYEPLEEDGFIECEYLYDTVEEITVKENGGCSTIEIYKDKEIIWENAEFENKRDL